MKRIDVTNILNTESVGSFRTRGSQLWVPKADHLAPAQSLFMSLALVSLKVCNDEHQYCIQ